MPPVFIITVNIFVVQKCAPEEMTFEEKTNFYDFHETLLTIEMIQEADIKTRFNYALQY